LTVVRALRARGNEAFVYVGRANSVEEQLARRAQIPFRAITTGQVRGQAPWTMARSLWRMTRSIGTVRALIREFQPDVIFVTGGYVSAPVVWAGAAEKIPRVIYLPDMVPGWAVRVTSRWATSVAVSFPEAARHFAPDRVVVTGYPVRAEFFTTDTARARARFQLDPTARTVAIMGGSTGAHNINRAVVMNYVALAELAQVIHLTGKNDVEWVRREVEQLSQDLEARVRVFDYLDDDLPAALAAADVVVARAGAATLGEFPALGLPAILVPGPFAGKHQTQNARFLVERGAAVMLDDATLKQTLIPTLRELLAAPEKLNAMRAAMRALANPQATQNIVDLLTQHAAREAKP